MFITHTFNADLEIQLIAPDGTTIWLADEAFGSGEDAWEGVIFDDDANPLALPLKVSSYSSEQLSTLTPLQPQQALSRLNGLNPNGTWTLRVADDYGLDTGTLSAFSLSMKTVATLTTGTARTHSSTAPVAIPDSATTPAVSTITIPTTAWADIASVEVGVTITHASPNHLNLTLIAPNHERYVLAEKRGSTCAGFYSGAVFTEAAADPVNRASTSPCPTGASAAPESSLGKLVGLPIPGDWKLEVTDVTSGTSGTINSWSLTFIPSSCDLPR